MAEGVVHRLRGCDSGFDPWLPAGQDVLNGTSLVLGETSLPFRAERVQRARLTLLLPRLRPECRLLADVGDPLLPGQFLDLRGAPGVFGEQFLSKTRHLPSGFRALDGEPQVGHRPTQPAVERGLEVRRVPHHLPELSRLPPVLLRVEGRVEGEAVGVQVGVGYPVHRPRGEMHELGVQEVAGGPLGILPALPHPCLDIGLKFLHRLPHRRLEGGEDAFVLGQRVQERQGLRGVKVEVVADGAVVFRPGSERTTGSRVPVVAQTEERLASDLSDQAQTLGPFTAPATDDGVLGVIVLVREPFLEVALGAGGRSLLVDSQHAPCYAGPDQVSVKLSYRHLPYALHRR